MLIEKCATLRSEEIRKPYRMELSLEGVRHDDVWYGFWSIIIYRVDRYYCRTIDSISK